MAKPELLGEVKKPISMGKEKGFLTYDELNSTLPAEVVSSEQFGSIMTMFGEMDIEIVDAPEGERIRKVRDSEDSNEDAEDAEDLKLFTSRRMPSRRWTTLKLIKRPTCFPLSLR